MSEVSSQSENSTISKEYYFDTKTPNISLYISKLFIIGLSAFENTKCKYISKICLIHHI